jgi:hypothetical protein
VGLLAAGTAVAGVLWLSGGPTPSAGGASGRPAITQRLEEAISLPSPDSPPSGSPSSSAAPLAELPSASAAGPGLELPKPTGPLLGKAWPGSQFRQVPAGTLESRNLWLETFRVVRRPEAATNLDGAFRNCSEIGLSLCSEVQWEAACNAFAEVGKDRSLTDNLEGGSVVERGGEGCAARKLVPGGSGGEQLGLCCERSIGMSSKNIQKSFLSSTGAVLKKLESALNQHDTTLLVDLLDDKVKLDGVERSKASVVALLAQTFKASPDLIVTHESCDISVQANKIVKRSRRGRKVTTYETNSWTAACRQMRHQKGEATLASAEYVFSPASKVRSISAKNQSGE